ncbi:heme exporter protein CcmD [Cupriavidus sp. 2MCAB6]|uniref:heme exporter protein CcmD n=1 Tax=Pseudomonadota TaxID=1224 RepID=UPI003F93419C
MSAFGPHAGYILTAYASVVMILGGLILMTWRDHRAQRQALDALEQRGAGRRSGKALS